ncbi:MAG: SpaA isopeptide-forming pilin-related protein, partial [Eubacterium sp.]
NNFLKRGSIEGIKVDTTTNTAEHKVQGAVIGLYSADGKTELAKATTDVKGQYTFSSIPYGNYVIKEITPPAGYYNTTDQAINVTVSTTEATKITEKINNSTVKGELKIQKTDRQTGETLAGAQFTLTGKNLYGDTITLVSNETDTNGSATITNIPIGFKEAPYTLTETKTPANHEVSTTIYNVTAELKHQAKLFTAGTDTVSITMTDKDGKPVKESDQGYAIKNTPVSGNIHFIKQDTTGRTLKGIGFTLTRTDKLEKGEVGTFKATSGNDGSVIFKDIPYGNYTLKEDPTDGIKTGMTDVTIQATTLKVEKGSFDYVLNNGTVSNTLETGSEKLTKVDQNGATLANVSFDITRQGASGNTGFELNPATEAGFTTYAAQPQITTDAQGVLEVNNLPQGHYKLTEDMSSSGISGQLSGAAIVIEITVDKNGKVTIKTDANVTKVGEINQVKNTLKTGTVQVNKIYGESGTQNTGERPGATFKVYSDANQDQAPDSMTEVMTLNTNKEGHFEITQNKGYLQNGSERWLLEGHYLLKETDSANKNYQIDTGYHAFRITNGQETLVTNDINTQGFINTPDRGDLTLTKFDELYKLDANNHLVPKGTEEGIKLGGADFIVVLKGTKQMVTHLNDNKNGTYTLPTIAETTAVDGYTTVTNDSLGVAYLNNGKLLYGDYTIVEVKAPIGYEDKQTTKDITIKGHENADIIDTIANTLIERPFSIHKYFEAINQQAIDQSGTMTTANKDKHFSFTITRTDDSVPSFKFTRTVETNDQGIADFSTVPYGIYNVTEVKAPENYVINSATGKITVTADGVFYNDAKEALTEGQTAVQNSLKRGS